MVSEEEGGPGGSCWWADYRCCWGAGLQQGGGGGTDVHGFASFPVSEAIWCQRTLGQSVFLSPLRVPMPGAVDHHACLGFSHHHVTSYLQEPRQNPEPLKGLDER